jgi:hypothetical protein
MPRREFFYCLVLCISPVLAYLSWLSCNLPFVFTYNKNPNIHAPGEFFFVLIFLEPAIPAGERLQTNAQISWPPEVAYCFSVSKARRTL